MVDVNVHPTKLEVRFQDSGRIYSQLLSTIRTRFLSSDLSTRVETPDDDRSQRRCTTTTRPIGSGSRLSTGPREKSNRGVRRPNLRPTASRTCRSAPFPPLPRSRSTAWIDPGSNRSTMIPRQAAPWLRRPQPLARPEWPAVPKAIQIHNRYLVSESPEGVVIIDQHALHERILYEQLRRRVEQGPVEAQSLLVPEPVDLPPAEAAAAMEHQNLLARLGLRIEPFGGDTILVSSYPAMLSSVGISEVLRGLLEPLMAGGKEPDSRDMLDDLLNTIACKAAVKAGDYLTPDEIDSLLGQRHLVDDPHHCPHGRPTALVFSREELDKKFKRI